MATNNYYQQFAGFKNQEEEIDNLPLLPLQSKFSITSQMNPVKGLEMKRLISVNQDGAAEPYIDLGNQSYVNYFGSVAGNPSLANQTSLFLDFNNQQNNINYIPGYNNQISMVGDIFLQNNQSFMDKSNLNSLNNVIQGNQRQNQNYYPQPQQNFFVNANMEGNNTTGNQTSNFSQQVLQNQQNNQSNNLIFKNQDQFNNYISNSNNNMKILSGNLVTTNGYNPHFQNHLANLNKFQNDLQKQKYGGNIFNDIKEKEEAINQVGLVGGGYNQYLQPQKNYNFRNNQQIQSVSGNPNTINFQFMQNHQDFIDKNEAEYIPEHKSQHDDSNKIYQNNNKNEERYQDYSENEESHSRNKTEWPSRQKGQTKYQQCRHRNIFKNFGNIFRKFVNFHNHFTNKALESLNNSQEALKNFQKWLKKEIRLENKKDFIEGWTVWRDEEPKIRQFKLILKELSRDFFQDYILIYLLNSKLQDLEIHLRSIGPCLAAINQPSILYKFRPI